MITCLSLDASPALDGTICHLRSGLPCPLHNYNTCPSQGPRSKPLGPFTVNNAHTESLIRIRDNGHSSTRPPPIGAFPKVVYLLICSPSSETTRQAGLSTKLTGQDGITIIIKISTTCFCQCRPRSHHSPRTEMMVSKRKLMIIYHRKRYRYRIDPQNKNGHSSLGLNHASSRWHSGREHARPPTTSMHPDRICCA